VGTRILVKNEANAVLNGVYTWANATNIVRSADTDEYGPDSTAALSINDYFYTTAGNVNLGTAFVVSAPSGTITFGTSNITFSTFATSQVYSGNALAGISLNGTVINAKVDGVTTAFDGTGNISVKASATLTTPNIGAATGTSLSTTGNVTGGNILTGGLISAASTVTGSQFNGSGAGLTSIPGGNVIGTLTSTVLGNSTVFIGTTGVALNRASGALTLAGVSLSTLTIGTGLSGTSYNGSGAVTIATNQDISTSASPTFAGLTVGTGTITGGNIVNGNGNGVGNIGSSSVYFNTVFAKATSAQYADLAENYQADADYTPGTVLEFGGEQEVTLSTQDSSKRVAGVVSTNPAHLMNSRLDGDHVIALALAGRVPVLVTGRIAKGDLMVSAGNGRAKAKSNPAVGTVIGKALENFDGGEGTIEIVISML
jgi:hypothetical protein